MRRIVFLLILCLVVSSCASQPGAGKPTATPGPTDTPLPTSTPLPTDTPLPTNTPTSKATNTPQPTPTPPPTYTPPPITRDTLCAPADFGCLAFQLEPDAIWLLRGGEVPQPLTQGNLRILSPDGRFLAFSRTFPTEVWIRDLRDSTETLLYVGRPLVYDMAWSPDGKMLAITNGAHAKYVPTGDLWRVDVPQGTVRQLAEENGGSPHFSPDGRWIAPVRTYWSPRVSLAIMRPDGGEHRLLFDYLLSQRLEWASDSSGFALALTRMGASEPSEKELWWVPTDGDPLQLGRLVDAGDVQWQPGAQRLLYTPLHQGEQALLHLANRDGSGDVVVPGSQGMILRGLYVGEASGWSPDGRWFLAANSSGHFYLLDTHKLDAPWPLDVEIVYGWLDAGHYLAGYSRESYVDLQRCVPRGACEFLAHIPGRIAALSYVNDCGK
jgi:WD40 repeat protein